MNINIGFTSVTFRKKSIDEIIEIAKENNISILEWGTDVHIDSIEKAIYAKNLCEKNNIKTITVGSYYRVGDLDIETFKKDLEIAKILGAKRIRVWCGRKGSNDTTKEELDKIIEDTNMISSLSKKENIEIGFEFHRKTYNDCYKSSNHLLKILNNTNVYTMWQPFFEGNDKNNLENVIDNTKEVHVFSWNSINERFEFEKEKDFWKESFDFINSKKEVDYIMEFVKNDDVEQFKKDLEYIRNM